MTAEVPIFHRERILTKKQFNQFRTTFGSVLEMMLPDTSNTRESSFQKRERNGTHRDGDI
jgi:hypothetical protein